ncbi:hypothetical protein FW778_14535 [Ginsengibacter hankyongi]|uniref:Uncharacterized protein n=1 Tax=Ginsengibacter hankyongi TaxID=2607284 RepID=A0A5J5IEE8_9BACT|nr:hypothetical protein [Ginsengibacter hankyongi]KAA9037983.1 hypothetical protein FW778_14535 [Ginsengibacter hankyongi]
MKTQEKIENNRNRNALVIAIIGGFAIIVAAIIPLFKNSSAPPKQKVEIKANHNSPVSGDIQTQNNYFLNGSIDSNKRNTSRSKGTNIKAEKTFHVSPSNSELEKLISANNYILAKREIRYSIEITFNGEIENVQNDLYRYNGGNLLIKINGETCSVMNDLMITPTFNGGNSKQIVLNEVNKKINELISEHTPAVYKKIMQCLK